MEKYQQRQVNMGIDTIVGGPFVGEINELGKELYTLVNTWPAASWLPMIDAFIASTPLGVVSSFFGDVDYMLKQSPFGVATTKFLLSLFVVYPFAVLLRNIKSKDGKNYFCLFGGVFLMKWIFGHQWIHSLISSLCTYILCMIAPKNHLTKIGCFFVMAYMTLSHCYAMYSSYDSSYERTDCTFDKKLVVPGTLPYCIDHLNSAAEPFAFTGTQMVLTMKLIAFIYNYHDGTTDKAKIDSQWEAENRDGKKTLFIVDYRKRYYITELPSLLDFLGYVYCFPAMLVGPAFEFQDYLRAIDGSIFGNKPPPSSFGPAIKCLGISIVALALKAKISPYFPYANIYSTEFMKLDFDVKCYTLYLTQIFERVKYYFIWKAAEGSCILAGFGYDPKENNWKGVENIDILGFELAVNIQDLQKSWNKRTQSWLANYFFFRFPQTYSMNMMVTYFVSALWHGLYPGYFISFMTVPILDVIQKATRAKLNKYFELPASVDANGKPSVKYHPIWTLICFIGTLIGMNWALLFFNLYSWSRCKQAFEAFYYYPHMLFIGVAVVLTLLPKPREAKRDDNNKSGTSESKKGR